MDWYKTLTLEQKIAIKGEGCKLLLGVSFSDLGKLFNFKERMNMIHYKLLSNGFDV